MVPLSFVILSAVFLEGVLHTLSVSADVFWYAGLATYNFVIIQICARACRPSFSVLAAMLILSAAMTADLVMVVLSGLMTLAIDDHLPGWMVNQVAEVYTVSYAVFGYAAVTLTTLEVLALLIPDRWATIRGMDDGFVSDFIHRIAGIPSVVHVSSAKRIKGSAT